MFLIYEQLHVVAKQRNEQMRASFRRQVSGFQKHQLLFVDESSKDDRTFQVTCIFLPVFMNTLLFYFHTTWQDAYVYYIILLQPDYSDYSESLYLHLLHAKTLTQADHVAPRFWVPR